MSPAPAPAAALTFQKLSAGPSNSDLAALREALNALAESLAEISPERLLGLLQQTGLRLPELYGRKVAITGSAHKSYQVDNTGQALLGIGDAVAECMLMEGASVILNSFTPSMDQARLAHLKSYGPRCEYLQADLSTREGAQSFVEKSYRELGGLDVLVLNAGTYFEPEFPGCTDEEYDRIFNLNLKGPMHAINRFIELVGPDAKAARIIVTSSINAQLSESAHRLYDASKAALEAFVRSTAIELGQKGIDIRINCIAPGLLYTPLTYQALTADPVQQARLEAAIPLGIGRAQDIARAYVFLAKASTEYMTGSVLDLSGGLRIAQATETNLHPRK